MLDLFNSANIKTVISDKSPDGLGRIKELLNILSFKSMKGLKYPELKLIDELIKAAQMGDNDTITRISDDDNGITTKGKLNGFSERKFLNKFGKVVATYKGTFVNGSLNIGELTNNIDNSIYIGEFENNKKNGQGQLTALDGSDSYTGGFKMIKSMDKEPQ